MRKQHEKTGAEASTSRCTGVGGAWENAMKAMKEEENNGIQRYGEKEERMSIEVNAWVGNLGKYNEGELVGEWVHFPVDEDEWEEVMKRIHIGEQVDPNDPRFGVYEEIFFADYDSKLPLFDMFGEYPSVKQLNELADEVEDIEDDEVFEAMMSEYAVDVDQAIATYKEGSWRFFPGCDDMSDVAKVICGDDPAYFEAPDFMRCHFNFKSYGEELDSSGTFIPTKTGYVEIWG